MTPAPVSMPVGRTEPEQLVVVEDLVKHFQLGRGKRVHSVDGVSLTVRRGEVLGLVSKVSVLGPTATIKPSLRVVAEAIVAAGLRSEVGGPPGPRRIVLSVLGVMSDLPASPQTLVASAFFACCS